MKLANGTSLARTVGGKFVRNQRWCFSIETKLPKREPLMADCGEQYREDHAK